MIHLSKILCPTDFSESSQNAVRYAIEFGRKIDGHVRFLHVLPGGNIAAKTAEGYGVPVGAAEKNDVVPDDFSTMLINARKKGLQADVLMLMGEASKAINEQADSWGADLIIMGSHGRTGLKRLMVGSVAEAVFRSSAIPVLLVKQGAVDKAITD